MTRQCFTCEVDGVYPSTLQGNDDTIPIKGAILIKEQGRVAPVLTTVIRNEHIDVCLVFCTI